MARTILMSSYSGGNTHGFSEEYYDLGGYLRSSSTQGTYPTKISYAGTLYGLGVRVMSNSAANSYTLTLWKNNASTAIEVTIPAGQVGWFEDVADTVTVAAGDLIEIKGSGSAADAGLIYFSVMKTEYDTDTPTTNTISILKAAVTSSATAASTTYLLHLAGNNTTNTSNTNVEAKMQYSATLRNLRVKVTSNARTSNTIVKTRKGVADGNQSVTIGNQEIGWFEDTTNTDSVASGDLVCFQKVNGTGTSAQSIGLIQMDHQTTSDPGVGILILTNSGADTLGEPLTRYQPIGSYFTSWGTYPTTESNEQMKVWSAFTFKGLAVRTTGNSITSASSVTLRKNAADTALVTTIGSVSVAWNQNTSNTVTVAANDLMTYKVVTPAVSGSQTLTIRQFIIYTEIAGAAGPVTASEVASKNLINKFITKV